VSRISNLRVRAGHFLADDRSRRSRRSASFDLRADQLSRLDFIAASPKPVFEYSDEPARSTRPRRALRSARTIRSECQPYTCAPIKKVVESDVSGAIAVPSRKNRGRHFTEIINRARQ